METEVKSSKTERPKAVLNTYYDNGKVLVLDDVFGNELETNGFAKLPTNPIISPNGNPLTSRATTNLAIVEAQDGSVFGIYRGYGEPLKSPFTDPNKKIKEGASLPFIVSFEEDDVTPKPLPEKPIFKWRGRETLGGIEDLRIMKYNGGYLGQFVAARKPDKRGIVSYSGKGITLSRDLKVEEVFPLRGIPHFMKDFTPQPKDIDGLYVMHLNPRIPDFLLRRDFYRQFHSEHPGIWIAISYNLKTWQILGKILEPLEDETQIGAGTPALNEDVNLKGKLSYIHGMKGKIYDWRDYYGRAVLFDSEDPSKPIAMTGNFLKPTEPYETNEEYKINHVFPTGAVKRKVKIGSRVYDAHIISAGTGDITSSLYFVLVEYLRNSLKPMNQFKYHKG